MLIRVRNIYLSFAFEYINDIRSIIIVVDNTGSKEISARVAWKRFAVELDRERKRERERNGEGYDL